MSETFDGIYEIPLVRDLRDEINRLHSSVGVEKRWRKTAEEEVERLRGLCDVYKKLNALLAKENKGLAGLAVAHGWQGDETAFREGNALRASIAESEAAGRGEGQE